MVIRCAWWKCRSLRDCKNVGGNLTLPVEHVELAMCRGNLHKRCKIVRFCSLAHLKRCQRQQVQNGLQQGRGRVALDPDQLLHVATVLKDMGKPWAAVLVMLQLAMGERADCARQISRDWLQNLDPADAAPPTVTVPAGINGKTVSRTVPLDGGLATQLAQWLNGAPLQGGGCTWPWPGQNSDAGFLFPGLDLKMKQRQWGKPISKRAYLMVWSEAVGRIGRERAQAREAGLPHPLDDVDLRRLGSHTLKKSCVTELKAQGVSSSIVSAVTGTTGRTLEMVYDQATPARQRRAMTDAFAKVWCIPGEV